MTQKPNDKNVIEKDKSSASKDSHSGEQNEGEGNRTAARQYNEAQRRFVQSGKTDERAREAEEALDDESVRRELERAEAVGKSHSAGEDPYVKRR